jgi:CIC family chloride channel protein
MEAVALRGGLIRTRVVLAKMFASGICIASGGSVGREGPIVQIGAAMGSTLGQWFRIDRQRLRTLVGCGAAAGIAGTFNAPVAGALFAVEVILGDFGVAQFSPIVISSVAATVVSHRFLGDFPAFEVPTYSLVSAPELFAYAALGILAGLVALGFMRTLYFAEDSFDRIRIYPPLRGLLGGAVVGVIGIWAPHIFGVGYEAINEALNGSLIWTAMVALVLIKILAVSITIGSGGSGGVFAPSLFIGAMLGGAVGTAVHTLWPASTGDAGAYALVGMGAVVAASTHAPITAILIIFELTANYEIILPLMITCIIATLLATRVQSASIYTLKLLRRGIDIYKGRVVNVLEPVSVREVMRPDVVTVSAGDGLGVVISKFMDHPGTSLFVTDDVGRLIGVITAQQIRPIMEKASSLGSLIIAQDLVTPGDIHSVSVDASLADVMKHFEEYRGEVPVIARGRLVGLIWPEDVIARYNTEVFKRDMARSMVSAMNPQNKQESLPAIQDAVVEEIPAPPRFMGKTIKDLNIREDFGVSVLMITQEASATGKPVTTMPAPDYTFMPGDVVLVMGPKEALPHFARGRRPGPK